MTGHSLGLATVLIGCLWLGLLGRVLELTCRTPRERPDPSRAQRAAACTGPGSYAGPGSLGGTRIRRCGAEQSSTGGRPRCLLRPASAADKSVADGARGGPT